MANSLTIEAPPETTARTPTLADLAERLDLPLSRILARPSPGSATVEDAVALNLRERRLCELVDGVLVEKAMGFTESLLTSVLVQILWNHVQERNLGIVQGPDAMIRLAPAALLRIPDIAFFAWARLPGGTIAFDAVPQITPDLAVEVLSPSNGPAEMNRKLREYFDAGTRLVWYLDPAVRTVRVYTAVDRVEVVDESGTLDGGDVLPGFRLAIRDWFARAERPGAGA